MTSFPRARSLEVTFPWTATKGLHTIEVVADDIQNNINEIDENNNTAESALTLQQIFFPDLVIAALDATFVDTDVSSEQPLLATATVRNEGDADAFDFWVSLYRDDELVARRHVNELIVNAEQQVLTFEFDPAGRSAHPAAVADDPVSAVLESDESNNARTLALPALTLSYPDLAVERSPSCRREKVLSDGTSFDISATIANRGVGTGRAQVHGELLRGRRVRGHPRAHVPGRRTPRRTSPCRPAGHTRRPRLPGRGR